MGGGGVIQSETKIPTFRPACCESTEATGDGLFSLGAAVCCCYN